MSGEFVEFGGVNPDLDPELAMALKVSAEEEQERRERQKQRQLVAGERGVIVVEDDSRDHRRTCSACPPSAMCVNGAPPVFCASKVTGSAEVSVPADSGDQAVREALAAKLGVEGWQISLPSQQTRRAASNSGFSGHMSMRNQEAAPPSKRRRPAGEGGCWAEGQGSQGAAGSECGEAEEEEEDPLFLSALDRFEASLFQNGGPLSAQSLQRPPHPQPSHGLVRRGVYVLELRDGRYYVGSSNNIDQRIAQHQSGASGGGSSWCAMKGGVKQEVGTMEPGSSEDLQSWEMKETLTRMLKHGFENVRGWEFTQCAPLTLEQLCTIKTSIFGQGTLCRGCGKHGHFQSSCPNAGKPKASWLQELEDRIALANKKDTHCAGGANVMAQAAQGFKRQGQAVQDFQSQGPWAAKTFKAKACSQQRSSGSYKGQRQVDPMDRIPCVRCGRGSHALRACYARATVDGSPLSEESCSEELEECEEEESEEDEDSTCFRCGRTGHWQASCYARTHADGRRL